MALYNNGYPMTYPQYFPQYQQLAGNLQSNQPNLQPNLQQVANNMQIQNGGFVSVRSEEEARSYPIAYGNSITFKDETAPYVYVKTMGFSQLDRPVFEKFRLVKESDAPESDLSGSTLKDDKVIEYATKSEIQALQDALNAFCERLDALEKEVDDLKARLNKNNYKKSEQRRRNESRTNDADGEPI